MSHFGIDLPRRQRALKRASFPVLSSLYSSVTKNFKKVVSKIDQGFFCTSGSANETHAQKTYPNFFLLFDKKSGRSRLLGATTNLLHRRRKLKLQMKNGVTFREGNISNTLAHRLFICHQLTTTNPGCLSQTILHHASFSRV